MKDYKNEIIKDDFSNKSSTLKAITRGENFYDISIRKNKFDQFKTEKRK